MSKNMDAESEQRQMQAWYLQLQRERGVRANLADAIEQKIKSESNIDRLRALNFLLALEYMSAGRFADEERTYRTLHGQYPDDPLPLIFLAESKLHCQDLPEAGLPFIEEAMQIANRSGNFRRHALGVKARIALRLGAYDQIEDLLRALLALKFERGNRDCAIERDFFDRTPAGLIDEKLAHEYDLHSQPKV
jgi:hypothetical protein